MGTVLLTVVGVGVALSTLSGQAAKKPVPPLVADVQSANGVVTTVTDLKVRYVSKNSKKPDGTYALVVDLSTLYIEAWYFNPEEGSKRAEFLEIPLSTIRSLTWARNYEDGIQVTRRDGTSVVLRELTKKANSPWYLLEEKDAAGHVTRSQNLQSFDIGTDAADPESSWLHYSVQIDGFTGTATTRDGRTVQGRWRLVYGTRMAIAFR